MNILNNAFCMYADDEDLYSFLVKQYINVKGAIHLYLQPMPVYTSVTQIDISGYLLASMLPLALSFLLPGMKEIYFKFSIKKVYVYHIVEEKQEKLREMMKMVGISFFLVHSVFLDGIENGLLLLC